MGYVTHYVNPHSVANIICVNGKSDIISFFLNQVGVTDALNWSIFRTNSQEIHVDFICNVKGNFILVFGKRLNEFVWNSSITQEEMYDMDSYCE